MHSAGNGMRTHWQEPSPYMVGTEVLEANVSPYGKSHKDPPPPPSTVPPPPPSPITGGSCHKYNFCRDKHVFCRDKSMLAATICISLSRQNIFVTRKVSRQAYFCRDKIRVLSRLVCRDKSKLVGIKPLSRQNYVCRDKTFVATKMILLILPTPLPLPLPLPLPYLFLPVCIADPTMRLRGHNVGRQQCMSTAFKRRA